MIRYKRDKGAALVLVLCLVLVISALVVTLVIAMRMETQASRQFVDNARATMLAEEGIAYVQGLASTATGTNRFWISSPGRIISWTNGGASNPDIYDLFSGPATGTSTNGVLLEPNLNRFVISDNLHTALTGHSNAVGENMPIRWIYVRQDGTRDFASPPNTTDSANPIIGRFAFWADDESTRINANSAWKRTNNEASPNHPSKVNLMGLGLSEADADLIHQAATNTPFGSPEEPRRLSTSLAETLQTNRFQFTHFSTTPSLNPWGEPKIVLTTQADRAGGQPFLDILTTKNTDPGLLSNLSLQKVIAQIDKIQTILKRSDWPFAQGSFQNKYGTTNSAQIALDIIEYVRAAEASPDSYSAPAVEAMRVNTAGASVVTAGTLVGTARAPQINEIGVHLALTNQGGNKLYWIYTFMTELYLPKDYGISSIDLSSAYLKYNYNEPGSAPDPNLSFSTKIASTNITPGLILNAGNYAVVTGRQQVVASTTNRPTSGIIRVLLFQNKPAVPGFTTPTWSTAPLSQETNQMIPYTFDSAQVAPANITSVQISDPRLNRYKENWTTQTANTFGSQNANWNADISSSPPQDASGVEREATLHMPSLKGSASNPDGAVRSVAEIGYIPTGVGVNIPWRSLRLRPSKISPPDWALLDVFTAPMFPTNGSQIYRPSMNALAGLINLNNKLLPFTNFPVTRNVALRGLYLGTTNLSDSAIVNIENRTFSSSGTNYGGTNGFVSPGEIAEIQGVAETEAGEGALRDIVDLATVRGNTWSIYSIGQDLQQSQYGKLTVKSEKSVMTIVERRLDAAGTVKWRCIFWKETPY